MRYITLGVMAGIGAGYTVDAFFPFKPIWGMVAIIGCVIIGCIIQCRMNKASKNRCHSCGCDTEE